MSIREIMVWNETCHRIDSIHISLSLKYATISLITMSIKVALYNIIARSYPGLEYISIHVNNLLPNY